MYRQRNKSNLRTPVSNKLIITNKPIQHAYHQWSVYSNSFRQSDSSLDTAYSLGLIIFLFYKFCVELFFSSLNNAYNSYNVFERCGDYQSRVIV